MLAWVKSLWAIALALSRIADALAPISINGAKLFDEDGDQFFSKGVVYVRGDDGSEDPLVDADQCQIDAGLMTTAGINTVRVLAVDGSEDHDACMKTFADQGIYVWIELPSTKGGYIDADNPDWNMDQYSNWAAIIDAFASYNNTLTFSMGNQVVATGGTSNCGNTSLAAPYIKAAARDMKAFRDARGYRPVPISYTSSDDQPTRQRMAEYLACGDADSAIDLYGLAIYDWCGNSSYYSSGYDKLYTQFQDLDVPTLFSETGCAVNGGGFTRDFSDIETMYGSLFAAVFSGTIVYAWALSGDRGGEDGYGIVSFTDDALTGFPTTLDDYNLLSTVLSEATPTGTASSEYTPSNSAPSCPAVESESCWLIDGGASLPTIRGLDIGTVTARATWKGSQTESVSTPTGGAESGQGQTDNGDGDGDGDDHGGLSRGAIAGIVVGAVALLALVGVSVFWLLWRRRRTASRAEEHRTPKMGPDGLATGNNASHWGRTELEARSVGNTRPKAELQGSYSQESRERYELDGGGRISQHNLPPSQDLYH